MNKIIIIFVSILLFGCGTEKQVKVKTVVETQIKKKSKSGFAVDCYDNKLIMINELGLTDDQTVRILNIDEKYNELYLIRKNKSAGVRDQHRKRIESILTKQQIKKFGEAYMNKYGEAEE